MLPQLASSQEQQLQRRHQEQLQKRQQVSLPPSGKGITLTFSSFLASGFSTLSFKAAFAAAFVAAFPAAFPDAFLVLVFFGAMLFRITIANQLGIKDASQTSEWVLELFTG